MSDSRGNVRGSYSYLDDKGQTRTVEYIAGPNIGYQVINNRRPLVFGPNGTPIPALPSLSPLFPDSPSPSPFSPSSLFPDTPLTPVTPTPLIPLDWTPTTATPTSPWPTSTPSSWLDSPDPGFDDFDSLHHQLFPEGLNTAESAGFKPRKNQTRSNSCCGRSWKNGPKRGTASRGSVKFDSTPPEDGSPRPIALQAHVQSIDLGPEHKRYMSPGEALELYNSAEVAKSPRSSRQEHNQSER